MLGYSVNHLRHESGMGLCEQKQVHWPSTEYTDIGGRSANPKSRLKCLIQDEPYNNLLLPLIALSIGLNCHEQ